MKLRLELVAAAVMGMALVIGAVEASADSPRQPPQIAATSAAPLPPLTIDQVRTVLAGRLVMQRSDLTIGKIVDKDAYSYEVELRAADGSQPRYILIDKQTGRPGGMGMHHQQHGCPNGGMMQ